MRPFTSDERAAILRLHPGVTDTQLDDFVDEQAAAYEAARGGDRAPLEALRAHADQLLPRLLDALDQTAAPLGDDGSVIV